MAPIYVCLIGMLIVVGAILLLRVHAFLALLLGALVVMCLTTTTPSEFFGGQNSPGLATVPKSMVDGFGSGCAKVGIIIALAAIIGQCLLESRAAEQIVGRIRLVTGEANAPKAFMASGFLLGIPVFFDTVFYLLFPIIREYSRRAKGTYLLCLLATVAGASMAHSLVPPTPGPLLVAAELNVSLGVLIPFGLSLGLITITVGYVYASWANKIWPLPIRSLPTLPEETNTDSSVQADNVVANNTCPSFFFSTLPILVPVVLIVIGTVVNMRYEQAVLPRFQPQLKELSAQKEAGIITEAEYTLKTESIKEEWKAARSIPSWLAVITEKNIALSCGAVLAMLLISSTGVREGRTVEQVVRDALSAGGVIILITAAGATFGFAMKNAGIAQQIQGWASGNNESHASISGFALLLIAFSLTTAVRVAQGSATVAMMTCVAVVAPIAASISLGFHPVYLALAIGCGSKPGPWMNDSGFWVVSRMSGMTELETLRSFSVLLTIMGFTGLGVVLIAAWLIPFV